ncbi:MAG: hypothetical protein QM793_00450 [Muricomes sp.]
MVFFFLNLTGCGSRVSVDKEKSPVLEYVEIYSKNSGTEDSQQVRVNLFFDRAVQVNEKKGDSIRLTIGGKRIQTGEYQVKLTEEPGKISIIIPVTSITTAELELGISEKAEAIALITDETGKYAAQEFTVSGVVPSGVMLQDVADENGKTVPNQKRVVSPFSIRSIAWLQLLDQGEPVEVSDAPSSETMENAVAVHGHEFLRDSKSDVAENITQVINTYYGDAYEAVCQDDIITIQSKTNPGNTSLGLALYTYIKVNGKEQVSKAEEKAPAKTKVDRVLTDEDNTFSNALHMTYADGQNSPYASGQILYKNLRITGKSVGEEQIYSVSDLESLVSISFKNNAMYSLGLAAERKEISDEEGTLHSWQGIDFRKFLDLCRGESGEEPVYVECTWEDGVKKQVFRLDEIGTEEAENPALIAFGKDGLPILPEEEGNTPLCLIFEDGTILEGITQIIIDSSDAPQDPHYTMHHLRDRYNASNDISITFNLYKGEELQESKVVTTKELEEMALAHPEAMQRGYYGVYGNKETFASMGTGGWLDYFEGINLYWLISQELGEIDDSAKFQFYDREQKLYAQIDDSSYLKDSQETKEYYVLDREGRVIPGAVPMLAYGKNGYPLLKEHEHESAEYVAFNFLNHKLEEKGIATEIGVVKNHNGPFIAGLGNRDGMYGGNQKETGKDCVRIDIVCKD